MKLLSPRLLALLVLLILAVPLLAACSGDSQAAVAAPAIITLPTAAVVQPAARAAVAVVPAGMPQLTNNSAPTPTFLPSPPRRPTPPTPTTQPVGPGGLAFPLKTDKLN